MASALESESATSTLPLPPLVMIMTKYVRMRRSFEVIHKSYGASYVVRKDLDIVLDRREVRNPMSITSVLTYVPKYNRGNDDSWGRPVTRSITIKHPLNSCVEL